MFLGHFTASFAGFSFQANPVKSRQEVLFTRHLGITKLPEARAEKGVKFIFSVWLGSPWSYSSPGASV